MSTADPSIALLPIGSEAPRLRPTPRRGVHASIHLEPNLNPSSVLGAEFLRAWLEGPRPYLRSQRLARPTVPSDALPDGSTVLRCATSDVGVEVLAQAGPCLVLIDSRKNSRQHFYVNAVAKGTGRIDRSAFPQRISESDCFIVAARRWR